MSQKYDVAKVTQYVKSWLKDIALIMRSYRNNLSALGIEQKKDHSYVTQADQEVNEYILQKLQHYFPDHQVLSEETVDQFEWDANNPYLWVIDPIDGTHEFMKADSNYFCCSIAWYYQGQPLLGMVYAPLYTEYGPEGALFEMHADLNQSLFNGQSMTIDKTSNLDHLQADINYSTEHPDFEEKLTSFRPGFKEHHPKALALQTCKVAASGTVPYSGIMLQHQPKLWDMAAALYIAQGAGAQVVNLEGQSLFPIQLVTHQPDFRIPTVLVSAQQHVALILKVASQTSLKVL